MNPIEQLCVDKADELVMLSEAFLHQFKEADADLLKLISPMRLIIAEYKTNRNLVEMMAKLLPKAEGKS